MRRSDVRAGALACVIACACAGEDAGDTEATESPPIPDDPEGLHAWALERAYLLWPAWSEVRPTGGTGGARVYLSPDLVDSLRAGATVHPEGATAVRELYGEDLATRTGLAVICKTDAADEVR